MTAKPPTPNHCEINSVGGESGFWVAECPSLPGCVPQGQSREEAIANAREAINGYVQVLEEDGLPVPEEMTPKP